MQTSDLQRVGLETEEENRVALKDQTASKKQDKVKFMEIFENHDGTFNHYRFGSKRVKMKGK